MFGMCDYGDQFHTRVIGFNLCPPDFFLPVTEILFRELEVRQVALRHLIHFLKEIGDQKLLLDLFR